MFDFPQIAATAKSLGIVPAIRPAVKDRDDVVEFQIVDGRTVGASRPGPFTALPWRKLQTMAAHLWLFVEMVVFASWFAAEHFIATFRPQLARRFANALACLLVVTVAQGVLVPDSLSAAGLRDFSLGRIAMGPPPKGIVFAFNEDAKAGLRASLGCTAAYLSGRPIEAGLTNRADERLPLPCVNAHLASKVNGVNSGKHLDSTPEYKSILSQAQAGMPGKVQRLEAETRTVGNASTSALPERDEIVRAAWRHAEVGSKRPNDNNTDDMIDTTPMDGITASFWPWRQLASSISINGLEREQNSGEYQMLDLLEEKSGQALDGIHEKFAKAFLQGNGINSATAITTAYTSPINGSVFVDPLPLLVGQTPTGGTIGSIAANVSDNGISWWANQKRAATDTNYASFLKDLDGLRNDCGKGVGGFPDMHLVDQATHEFYCAALRSQNRFTDYTRADIPFDNVSFHKQPVVWDEFMPNWSGITTAQSTSQGSWVMLNSKFIQFKYSNKTNFRTTPFVRPENQDADVATILWYGAAGVTNRRKHGVLSDINTTLTS